MGKTPESRTADWRHSQRAPIQRQNYQVKAPAPRNVFTTSFTGIHILQDSNSPLKTPRGDLYFACALAQQSHRVT